MSITTLLIANRGEITCRIARTAHAQGIHTIGVYAEPDSNAMHVDAVDVAVALGGSTPAESYLRGDAIIAAALEHGADAIHPGYGFLAENADFAQAVIEAGLLWVGPTPAQIRLLGDKVEAKQAASSAGVPTTAVIEASPSNIPTDVPLPALVKAAAGGGGRGMRIVRSADELADAVTAAAREAEAAFGDPSVFIEPYIEHGRHVEVQIFGDAHGNVIHLGERECSIQRRNQKIVEEAPSPGIDAGTRAMLTDGALALARHVGYQNAGTVEFLVGADGTIPFLEVNTRLQVEHPVTEAVTGLDLVALQLRVAAGEPLGVDQGDVTIEGHAIEVRVVAEDPASGWLPSTGRIVGFHLAPDLRVDTGFGAESVVSADYDSMLAKVIAHGPTRTAAAGTLARALAPSIIAGVRTNLDTLTAILRDSDFLAGNTPTSFLDGHPGVIAAALPDHSMLALVLGATFATEATNRGADSAMGFAPSGWRNLRTTGQRRTWVDRSIEHPIEYVCTGDHAQVLVGPWPEPGDDGSMPPDERASATVRILRPHDGETITLEVDGVRHVLTVHLTRDSAHVSGALGSRSFSLAPRFVEHEASEGGGGPVCPLPGTVIAVHVADGDIVAEGALLMVVEAMKMEHKITAPSACTVAEVLYTVGDRVNTGDLLVRLDDASDE
ncbi:MAG: biotin carboxylase N-terminal domain-containing protein [Acidimicrobiales bacterium]